MNAPADIVTTEVSMNLAGIDVVSMRLVVHCAELGSLSAAARRGNMSLSCASHRLTNLEGFFRIRFFERDYRGLQLTHAGEVFVTHANTVLQALDRLANQLATLPVRNAPEHVGIPYMDCRKMVVGGLKNPEYRVSR